MIIGFADPVSGLIGGILIGLGSLIAFASTKKVPGISGIFGRLLRPKQGDIAWRLTFLLGLMLGAGLAIRLIPRASAYQVSEDRTLPIMTLAGLIVGFGTRLGGGCTSGHGVCGMSRGIRDSIVATLIFMASAMLTVWIWNQFFGGGTP
ncbi:MAG: YeeE/YedE thiosulfate transporter family protein [Verrucomicrobiota bacterium]